jgi:CHASE3 domain sensor protein
VVEEKRIGAEIGWIGESGDKELAEVKDWHDHDVDPEGTERRWILEQQNAWKVKSFKLKVKYIRKSKFEVSSSLVKQKGGLGSFLTKFNLSKS